MFFVFFFHIITISIFYPQAPSQQDEGPRSKKCGGIFHDFKTGGISISGWLPTLLFVLITKTAHSTACEKKALFSVT